MGDIVARTERAKSMNTGSIDAIENVGGRQTEHIETELARAEAKLYERSGFEFPKAETVEGLGEVEKGESEGRGSEDLRENEGEVRAEAKEKVVYKRRVDLKSDRAASEVRVERIRWQTERANTRSQKLIFVLVQVTESVLKVRREEEDSKCLAVTDVSYLYADWGVSST